MLVPVVRLAPTVCPCCGAYGHHHASIEIHGRKVGEEFPCAYCKGHPRVDCEDCRKGGRMSKKRK